MYAMLTYVLLGETEHFSEAVPLHCTRERATVLCLYLHWRCNFLLEMLLEDYILISFHTQNRFKFLKDRRNIWIIFQCLTAFETVVVTYCEIKHHFAMHSIFGHKNHITIGYAVYIKV